jgi:alpha-L-fucosidase
MKGQLRELLTNYGEINTLFFDGDWIKQWSAAQGRDLEAFLRRIQHQVIINNRVGQRTFFESATGRLGKGGSGDYDTPEGHIPKKLPARDWETCMTFNDSWGYKESDHNWKDSSVLIKMLVDCVSLDGNFLLNIGPTGEGVVPAESVIRLHEIGEWMKRNSEAIYGATAGPVRTDKLRSTQKPGAIYLMPLDWPATISTKIKDRVKKVSLLSDPEHPPLKFQQTGDDLSIEIPSKQPERSVSVLRLEV